MSLSLFSPAQIARVCHEANRALTVMVGDVPVQPAWNETDDDMRDSCEAGVRFKIDNPLATPEDQHTAWMLARVAAGWTHGPVKDTEKKEHPALLPYAELPPAVRAKDKVFTAIVEALR